MGQVKKVGIRKLKSGLSAYLREVRSGATILVQDRDTCIAEIRRPTRPAENPVLQALATAGEVTLPKGSKRPIGRPPVTGKAGLADEILNAERAE